MSGERKPKRRSLGDDRGLTPEPKPRWHYEKTMLHRDGVRMFLAYPAGDAEGAWIADVLNERDDFARPTPASPEEHRT